MSRKKDHVVSALSLQRLVDLSFDCADEFSFFSVHARQNRWTGSGMYIYELFYNFDRNYFLTRKFYSVTNNYEKLI